MLRRGKPTPSLPLAAQLSLNPGVNMNRTVDQENCSSQGQALACYRQSELDYLIDSFDSMPRVVETEDYEWFPLALLGDEPDGDGGCGCQPA